MMKPLILLFYPILTVSFTTPSFHRHPHLPSIHQTQNNNEEITPPTQKETTRKGDPHRAATKKRPSLHPLTINAISEALLRRSSKTNSLSLDIEQTGIDPHEVALSAGRIAMDAIERRRIAVMADDGDRDMIYNREEGQTIAGRIVGVVMRFGDLERCLVSKVKGVDWIKTYGEYGSFGVLESECDVVGVTDDAPRMEDEGVKKEFVERIVSDPLFRMNRAECLLALFLITVEEPQLKKLGQEVPGGSNVDFIDQERLDVLS